MQFISEASFYTIRDSVEKEQKNALARLTNKLVPDTEINKTGWESYRSLLLSISDEQLKIIAGKVVELMFQSPFAFRYIVLVSLSRNP